MNKKRIHHEGDLTFHQKSPTRFEVTKAGSNVMLAITRIKARTKIKFFDGPPASFNDDLWIGNHVVRPSSIMNLPISLGAVAVGTSPERVWDLAAHILLETPE